MSGVYIYVGDKNKVLDFGFRKGTKMINFIFRKRTAKIKRRPEMVHKGGNLDEKFLFIYFAKNNKF